MGELLLPKIQAQKVQSQATSDIVQLIRTEMNTIEVFRVCTTTRFAVLSVLWH